MKIEIPKITRALKLSEYAPEFGEAEIVVWVNPPKRMVLEYVSLVNASDEIKKALAEAVKEAKQVDQADQERKLAEMAQTGERIIDWYAELWSQGAEDTRWSVEDIKQLLEGTQDTDPGLWSWLTFKSQLMIRTHRGRAKKG